MDNPRAGGRRSPTDKIAVTKNSYRSDPQTGGQVHRAAVTRNEQDAICKHGRKHSQRTIKDDRNVIVQGSRKKPQRVLFRRPDESYHVKAMVVQCCDEFAKILRGPSLSPRFTAADKYSDRTRVRPPLRQCCDFVSRFFALQVGKGYFRSW